MYVDLDDLDLMKILIRLSVLSSSHASTTTATVVEMLQIHCSVAFAPPRVHLGLFFLSQSSLLHTTAVNLHKHLANMPTAEDDESAD